MQHPGYHKDLVAVAFDRGYKIWNAGERAGFSEDVAAALVASGAAHYPEPEEAPALTPQLGSRTSGLLSCGRCGTFYDDGAEHVCPEGPPAGPEVFETGFDDRPRRAPGRPKGSRNRGS